MSYDSQNPFTARRGGVATQGEYDLGLRQYMLRVYNYMASGLAVTGIVAWLAADRTLFGGVSLYDQIRYTPLIWVVMFAPLIFVFALSAGIRRMSFSTAQALFWAFAIVMGVSMASVFARFTGVSIMMAFFTTAGMFCGMSLYGYTTKADLTRMGAFMVMGLIGIFIASLVNMVFLHSFGLNFAISVIGVIVFTGLTAWDTQRIAQQYYATPYGEGDMVSKGALMGALELYLDFLNLFLMLLRLFGNTRD